mmetsp:Transcript_21017/g.51343  ORF Transcript_21017/g.51343 Transcript_21017/m.51343 type:complete len:563 (+) Transcript_21017:333-2021(+)
MRAQGAGVDAQTVQGVTSELIDWKLKYAQNQEEIDRMKMPQQPLRSSGARQSGRSFGRRNSSFNIMGRRRDSSASAGGSSNMERTGSMNSTATGEDEDATGQTLKVKGKKGNKKFYVDDVTAKYLEDRAYVDDDSDFTSTDDCSSEDSDEDETNFPGGVRPVIHTNQARNSANRTKELAYRGIYGADTTSSSARSSRVSQRSITARTMSMRSNASIATNATNMSNASAWRLEKGKANPGLQRVESNLSDGDDEPAPGVQIFEDAGEADKNSKIFLMNKLDAVVIREPAMSTLEYGTAKWGMDLVAFMQNPIRREVFDLYYMFSSMSKRAYFLESDEFDLFYKWFELFRYAVVDFQILEEEVIYPVLEGKGGQSPLEAWHSKDNRKLQKKKVRDAVDAIWDFQDKVKLQAPGSALKSIQGMMDTMSAIMLSYYNAQLRALPKVIQRKMMPADVRSLEEKYVAAMRGRSYPHDLFQMIMHWSKKNSVEFRSRMRNAYMHRSNPVVKQVWKKQYLHGRTEFRKEHLKTVQGFFERWNAFEEERIRARSEAPVSQFQNPFTRGTEV